MEILLDKIKVIADALTPLFILLGAGLVGGLIGFLSAERFLPRGVVPQIKRMTSTLMSVGTCYLLNYADLLPGLTWSYKSWAGVIVAGVGGAALAEVIHDHPPPGLGWLKRAPNGAHVLILAMLLPLTMACTDTDYIFQPVRKAMTCPAGKSHAEPRRCVTEDGRCIVVPAGWDEKWEPPDAEECR